MILNARILKALKNSPKSRMYFLCPEKYQQQKAAKKRWVRIIGLFASISPISSIKHLLVK